MAKELGYDAPKGADHDRLVQIVEDAVVIEAEVKREEVPPEVVLDNAEPVVVKAKRAPKEPKAPKAPPVVDPRLPPPGTVLTKHSRKTNKTVECTVQEDGIYYNGEKFATLSGAAREASKDIGLFKSAVNGYVFFGLVKCKSNGPSAKAKLAKAQERLVAGIRQTVMNGDLPKAEAVIGDVCKALQELVTK